MSTSNIARRPYSHKAESPYAAAPQSGPRIRCVRFRAMSKNTLKGFADLELTDLGVVIRDCTWHDKDGSEWIGFPSRPYEDTTGARKWSPIVEFVSDSKSLRWAFQKAALAAIHEHDGGEHE